MLTLLAAISGQALLQAFIQLVVVGLILWVLMWFLNYVALPEPFAKVARVILALVAVIIVINMLLSFTGQSFITW